jgi:LAO/AO transport system kinase
MKLDMSQVVKNILAGDIRTAARLISDIDDNPEGSGKILRDLYPHTGRAYVIGITGAPGVGKSTLVDCMISYLREKQKTVGVLAIDPTSPFSGGAILGDRIRMLKHSNDQGVFIRSLATRGQFGGLSHSTRGAIDVLDAMGKDYIIVETVGVGQDEVEIVKSADTTVVLLIPGMGDDIQAIKAGILEAGDIFVINKSDREGAEKTRSDLKMMIEIGRKRAEGSQWETPIVLTEAISGKGIDELLEKISCHGEYLSESSGKIPLRRSRDRVREELAENLKFRIIRKIFERLMDSGEFEMAVESISQGETDPYSASEELIRAYEPDGQSTAGS